MRPTLYVLAIIGSFVMSAIMFSGLLFPEDPSGSSMFGYVWILIGLAFSGVLFMSIKKKKK